MSVYKNQNNDKYYCKFQVNGIQYHRLCRGATTKAEARELEAIYIVKVQKQQSGIIPKEETSPTLEKTMNEFLNYAKANKKSYKHDYSRNKLIISILGAKTKVSSIKFEDIEKLKISLLNIGKSKTTVNRYLEIFSAACNMAEKNGYIKNNPSKFIKKFPIKNYKVRYLKTEEKEEERLYTNCPEFFKPILDIALNTGFRKSNIRLLKWENINLNERIIELTENKGNKHIKMPINDYLYEVLSSLSHDNEYVFIYPKTKRIYSDSTMSRIWNRIKKAAKIEDLRFHDLRHTVGTKMAAKGVNINVIQTILAHSDIKTTMRYVHAIPKQVKDAVNLLHNNDNNSQ